MGNHVDAIDLTLTSSPEPEQRPAQQRQSQAQHNFKKESRPYGMGSKKIQVGHRRPTDRSNSPQQHTQTINPQHLRQIVHTSDEDALRTVLLQLCHISPALSGAVARGLAPHSTFARQVVSRRRNTAVATPNFEDENNDCAYDTDEKRFPGNYRGSVTRIASTASPALGPPKTFINVTCGPNTSLVPAQPPHAHRETRKRKACVNCHLSFTSDSEDVCMFHTGQKVRRDGQGVYSCCDAPLDDAGCAFACHASAEGAQQDTNARKRPSASPRPSDLERKRARKL